MQLFFLILLFQALLVFVFLIRFFLIKRKRILIQLFTDALQNENNRHFEAAIINYESVLNEVKRKKFYGVLKNKVIEKIKLLHIIMEYKSNIQSNT